MDLLEEPDHLDCMIELYQLKEECQQLDDEELINYIIQFDTITTVSVDKQTRRVIGEYFHTGIIDVESREIVENCYILVKNCLCLHCDEGGICHTMIVSG